MDNCEHSTAADFPTAQFPPLQTPLRRTASFDRFIPFRPSLDLESAHHKLLQGPAQPTSSPSRSPRPFSASDVNNQPPAMQRAVERSLLASTRSLSLDDADRPRPALEYKRRLSVALDTRDFASGTGSSRILPFSSHTPPASPSISALNSRRGSDPWLGSPGGSDNSRVNSPTACCTPPRKVRTDPDTVLLLSLRNDFYCSLLDWGRGNTIGAGVDDGAYIWNASTGDCQNIRPCPWRRDEGSRGRHSYGHVSSVRWDNTGGRLALGYSYGTLLIWDAGGMKVCQDMSVPKHVQLGCLCWWNNSVFCGTRSGRVYHFDLRDKSPLPVRCPPVHRGDMCNVQLSQDESTLACGGDDGNISVWEPRGGSVIVKLHAHKSGAKGLAWCPWRRNVLASGGGAADGFIRVWSVGANSLKTEVNTDMQVCNVLWSEDYRELVTSHSSAERNEILLWTARDWNLGLLAHLQAPQGRPLHQCLSPDHTTLASASADDRLSLWKLFPKKRNSVFSTSPLNLDRAIR